MTYWFFHNRPVEECRHFPSYSVCASFVFTCFGCIYLEEMEEVKPEEVQFELNKLCRTCLTENSDMRSIFLPDSSTGEALVIANMLMDFTNIQINREDGLPLFICLQCTVQIGRAYSFKRLCVQSDSNLRQYLGKPCPKLNPNHAGSTQIEPSSSAMSTSTSSFNNTFFEGYGMETSSSESEEDDYRDQMSIQSGMANDPSNEKLMAQQQLLKLARSQKSKNRKKKMAKALQNGQTIKKRINVCNVCKKKFSDIKSFRKHLRAHIVDRPFKCGQCSRSFKEENYLKNHMRTHLPDEEKPLACEICKKRFIHPTMLQKHLSRHTNERPFVCKICNKGCFAENSLIKHMKIHEKKEGDPALLKHICDYCRTEFPSSESLSIHIKQHTGSKPYVCNICGKCFPQRFNLELHLRTHTGERPFNCEVCKKGYVSKASLKIHMRTHTNERPFACEFCGKAFRQSGDLTSHKRLHGTGKPIECDVCQKRFTTVMKLKYHMRNHTGERPYVCKVCNRGFTVNTILLRHMRVHSGERPYVCVTCGKAFSQTSTLNNHMKVHNSVKTDQEKELRFNSVAEEKYVHQVAPQQQQQIIIDHGNRIIQEDSRIMEEDPLRILQSDTAHDGTRLLTDATHLLTDNRALITEDSRILVNDPRMVVNIVEPARLLIPVENRVMGNVADNRHLAVADGSRILTDKYLAYGSYHHRGHM
ncbi:zinc finger protein 25-like [Euwallacea similis]|uniref:zinc finger protein 25-like n=1 Tax=Euwallacea similis TaxID=1736056 RepID=UPI00344F2E98